MAVKIIRRRRIVVYCTGLVPCLSKSEAIGNKQQSAEALAEAEKPLTERWVGRMAM